MSDDFSARYRLLKCVLVDDGIRTHNAQEVATGKVVMVHINDAAGPDEVDAMRAQLASLPPGNKNLVLETATLASGFAVVTEFLPGLTSFAVWLGRDRSAGGALAADQASTDGSATSQGAPAEPGAEGGRKPAIRVTFKTRVKAPGGDAPPPIVPFEVPVPAPPAVSAPLAHSPPLTSSAVEAVHAPSAVSAPSATLVPSAASALSAVPAPLAISAHLAPSAVSEVPAPPSPTSAPNPNSIASADSFSAIFGAPVDPKSLDGGVEYVRSGPPAAAVNFALHSDVVLKTAVPTGEAGMPVPSAPASVAAEIPTPVAAPAPAIPAPAPAPVAAPGEFTMMFAPSIPVAAAVPPTAAPPVAPAVAPTPLPPVAPASSPAVPVSAPVLPMGAIWPLLDLPPLAPAAPVQDPTARSLGGSPAVPSTSLATPPAPPLSAAAQSVAPPAPSQFGWDTPAVAEAPVSKAPPGEFTLLFGAPATAAPLPDQVRNSPMKEAPPPAFSTLTPEKQLESPPVEPMHRVMSSNPSYAAGINQGGQSPIGNNLSSGGYAGGANYPPVQPQPGSLNYGGASYASGQPYQAMPEFAPQPPTPAYPAAHASPLFAQQKQLAGEPGSTPGILPPPIFSSGGSTPLSALGGAAPRVSANSGPSEYTQLIANGPAPVVPELKPAKTATADAGRTGKRRLPTGLIVVINAVLLIATLLIFFVYKTQVPTLQTARPAAPIMPNIPTAPRVPP